MNEFDAFLRGGDMPSSGPDFVEDLTSWRQLVTGNHKMNGHDFSRLANYDFQKAMAFLLGFAVSFPKEHRPHTPGELLGLVDWETPEACQAFIETFTHRQDDNNSPTKR